MKLNMLILLATSLFVSSCATPSLFTPTQTGERFTISNAKGEQLFDVTAPNGEWGVWDTTKKPTGIKDLEFMYQGPNQGMINAEIRIGYDASGIHRTPGEAKKETTVEEINKTMAHLLDKGNRNNLQDFYKPKELVHGIRNIAGIHCRYFSITNHSGPTLDTPTAEFRGMGSGRKEEEYLCPVMRDGKLWYLGVNIVYSLSDVAIQRGMNIDFYEMIKDFDRMLKPTLESLKLYGDLKQY